MKRTTLKGIPAKLALGLLVLAAAAAPSFAAELAAVPAQWTPPGGGAPIAMWGFVDASPSAANYTCPGAPVPWTVGPTLTATAGTNLTVNIKNCLPDPVSVFIPGQLKATTPVTFQDAELRERVRSFDAETAPAAVGSYTWTGVKEGTYLYHSGTHPQVQVQMGLYGALTVGNYGIANEATLVYSEIDPALHAAVNGGTYGTPAYPSTFDYMPRYFLINGAAYPDGADIAINTGDDVLLRFVSAGLRTHVPTLEGGLYMSLIAEDGNLYPFAMEQYGVELPAAKTIDAVINVGTAGTYALYDRALGLTNWMETGGGMLTYIVAGAAGCIDSTECDDGLFCNGAESCNAGFCEPGIPVVCDNGTFCDGVETCSEGELSHVCDPGTPVDCNDGVGCTTDSCNEGTDSCDNVPDDGACPNDGAFCNGNEFCDAVLDCSSTDDACLAGETCNELLDICETAANIAPFANDDFATVTRNTTDNVINVTDNDVDADGTIDVTSVVLTNSTTSAGGTVAVNPLLDGTVLFTPRRGFRGTDLFTYTVLDNDGAISNQGTVRVNVVRP